MNSKEAFLVLGNQLVDPKFLAHYKHCQIFMAEDRELCTYYKFHKHKIAFFFAAMRAYAEELEKKKIKVHYHHFQEKDKLNYDEKLKKWLKNNKIEKIYFFEIEDKFFEKRLKNLFLDLKIDFEEVDSPLFICRRDEFKNYVQNHKRPFMKTFYEAMRKKHGFLMLENGKPEKGKYSFDSDNRKKLPKNINLPKVQKTKEIDPDLSQLIEKVFHNHPGQMENFWSETTRSGAKRVFKNFLNEKLENFGNYQDAISPDNPFLFHSTISHYINVGLLDPCYVVEEVERTYHLNKKIPINSAEGFIRQVLGWREFIRGIYQNFSEKEEKGNFFKHQVSLPKSFWQGQTGIPPVDDAVLKANEYSYCHHIERLMVLGSFMNLCEFKPEEIHQWFMELFIDSSDWVMGPNVYGMALFSDGGIFATKPYVCGSNYYLKMSDYKKGEWCDVVDGLYWSFIEKNKKFFHENARMGFMIKQLEKMSSEKKDKIYKAKKDFIKNKYSLLT